MTMMTEASLRESVERRKANAPADGRGASGLSWLSPSRANRAETSTGAKHIEPMKMSP